MNWYKIIGIILIVMACSEMLSITIDYTTGKMKFWPFGAEIGAILIIWLGVFLVRRGARPKNKLN
jgi:hypothetical protein